MVGRAELTKTVRCCGWVAAGDGATVVGERLLSLVGLLSYGEEGGDRVVWVLTTVVLWMLVYEVGEGWRDYGSRLVDFGDLGLILGGCMVLVCKWVSWV